LLDIKRNHMPFSDEMIQQVWEKSRATLDRTSLFGAKMSGGLIVFRDSDAIMKGGPLKRLPH
jgi:hypothetical protein